MKKIKYYIKFVILFIFNIYLALFKMYPYTVAYITTGVVVSIVYRDTFILGFTIVTGLFGRFVGWLMKQEVTIFHIK